MLVGSPALDASLEPLARHSQSKSVLYVLLW